MKKIVSVLISMCLIAASAFAQWEWQYPLPQGNNLNDVFFIDSLTGWAVGEAGTVIKSVDGGISFEVIYTYHLSNFTGVKFFNHNQGLICGDSGTIFKSGDGGLSWSQVSAGTDQNFTDLCIRVDGKAWITGEEGFIFYTANYGDSWQLQYSNDSVGLNSIFFIDDLNGWAAGGKQENKRFLLRTYDGGITWVEMDAGLQGEFTAIQFLDTLNGFALGSNPVKTTDGGNTWESIGDFNIGMPLLFLDIFFLNESRGYIVGELSFPSGGPMPQFYCTNDGGATWQCDDLIMTGVMADGRLNSLYFTDSDHGWVVGSSGNLGRIYLDGQVFVLESICNYERDYDFRDVFFTDEENGWVVGAPWYPVIHTQDGGNTWHVQSFPYNEWSNSVYFIDPNQGWIASESPSYYNNKVFHTNNGGQSWNEQFAVHAPFFIFRDIWFTSSQHGWVVGGKQPVNLPPGQPFLYQTSDGGTTWIDRSSVTDRALSSICFIDQERGWIAGNTFILKTINAGESWDILWDGDYNLRDVCFTDVDHGWVIGDSTYLVNYIRYYRKLVMRTTNGGLSWETTYFDDLEYYQMLNKVQFVDENHGWIIGDYGHNYYTSDGGVTWERQYINTLHSLRGISFINEEKGWIVGDYSTIFHTTNGGISGFKPISGREQNSELEVQVYPNPTRGGCQLSIRHCRLSIGFVEDN